MSWKSVELQVALPRTQDAGKQQDLLSKQGQRFQETLSQNQLQEEMKKRKQVQKFEKTSKAKVDDEQKKADEKSAKDDHHGKGQDENIDHPYLGSRFDFSG